MPLLSTILWLGIHGILAAVLNFVFLRLGLIEHLEVALVYFLALSARIKDVQTKFLLAYKNDPVTVQSVLNKYILGDENESSF